MAKCARCDTRKARRHCPALGSDICTLCCGRLRGKEISCPPGCAYLAHHAPYQEKRILERRSGPEAGPARRRKEPDLDDRMKWLFVSAEAALKEIADRNPAFRDKDVLLACEYARDKLARGERRIILPGEARRPGNLAGEALHRAVSRCRFERTTLIAGTAEAYTVEEQAAALDYLVRAARSLALNDWEGRAFLDKLGERFDRMGGPSGEPRLIKPV
jgi:hypothetical protein